MGRARQEFEPTTAKCIGAVDVNRHDPDRVVIVRLRDWDRLGSMAGGAAAGQGRYWSG